MRKRVNKINYYLNIAEEVSRRSTCLKRAYGAIIVKNDEIISTGYNGAPRGILSCIDKEYCLRTNAERGKDYSNCLSVHAEQNAIISASRRDMIGGTLYLVGIENGSKSYVDNPSPCSLCKRLIINSGIEKIIIRVNQEDYIEIDTNQLTMNDIIGGY